MKTLIITIAMLIAAANLSAGEPLDTLWSHNYGHISSIKFKFVYNDTKILVTANNRFYVLDVETGDTLKMSQNFGTINGFDISENQNAIIASITGLGVKVIDFNTLEIIDSVKGLSGLISIDNTQNYVAIYHSVNDKEKEIERRGILINSLNERDSVKFIETALNQLRPERTFMTGLKFSPDGRFLAATISDSDIPLYILRIYDGTTHKHIKDIGGNFLYFDFSQDGSLCIAKDAVNGRMRIFETETWTTVFELNNVMYPGHSFTSGIISRDNKKVILLSERGDKYFAQIWEIKDKILKKEIENLGVLPNALSNNNNFFIGIGANNGFFFLIDIFPILLNMDTQIPDYMNLYYNNGFSLSSIQEIISTPMIEVFNLNGGIVLPLSPMIPFGGVYKNNTPIPHGLYLIKLHVNNQIYNTNIIVE